MGTNLLHSINMGILLDATSAVNQLWLLLSKTSFVGQIILTCALPSLWVLVGMLRTFRNPENRHVPIVGKGTSIVLPIWRARIRYINQGVELIKNGYLKVHCRIEAMPEVTPLT